MERSAHWPHDASTTLLTNTALEIIDFITTAGDNYDAQHRYHVFADGLYAYLDELATRGHFDLVYCILDELTDKVCLTYREDTWKLKAFLARHEYDSIFAARLLAFIVRTENGMLEGTERRFCLQEFITGQYTLSDSTATLQSKYNLALLLRGITLANVERSFFYNLDLALSRTYGEDRVKIEQERGKILYEILPALTTLTLHCTHDWEQVEAAVSFLTGLSQRSDGTYAERYANPEDPIYGISRTHFQLNVRCYLQALTPRQIDCLKGNVIKPLVEALADTSEERARLLHSSKTEIQAFLNSRRT